MVYLVQRGDCDRLSLCRDLDPAYARPLIARRNAGLKLAPFGAKSSQERNHGSR
jgi:sugar fermentation stimulation protein A